ncbi:MAG: hypothetical protein GX046_06310 [Tissierellia bacterium]|nr:hypothetical protein [Tissierellia bacterium]
MINKMMDIGKKLGSHMYLFLKRTKFNSVLNKKLKKEDLNYLTSHEKNQAKNYWRKYTKAFPVNSCSYYSSRGGGFDKGYIPDSLYYTYIDAYFNNKEKSFGMDDKNYYNKLIPNLLQPPTLLRKINGYYYGEDYNLKKLEEIGGCFDKDKKYILKPSLSTQSKAGKNILFIDNPSSVNVKDLLATSDNFIIQQQVKQHKVLASLHPSSLNTIRVASLFFKGEVQILSSVLRIGVSGSRVDAGAAGGLIVGIDQKGFLKKKAYSLHDRQVYTRHPDTGVTFEGLKIPSMDEVLAIVKQEAVKLPDFRIIAWDFAIDENADVVFIEFNLRYGQLDFHQFTNGPFFKDFTDEVLEEVFLDKKKKVQ